jgi:hypothetical protein
MSGFAIFLRHSFSQTLQTKYRNINLLTIPYAFQPRVRIRLTLGGVTWPRNPWIYGGGDSRPPSRYSFQHQLLCNLQYSLSVYLRRQTQCSPTILKESIASVDNLAPLHFRRSSTSPVSYYAFFKGWLLLSQPPGCQSRTTTFPT